MIENQPGSKLIADIANLTNPNMLDYVARGRFDSIVTQVHDYNALFTVSVTIDGTEYTGHVIARSLEDAKNCASYEIIKFAKEGLKKL